MVNYYSVDEFWDKINARRGIYSNPFIPSRRTDEKNCTCRSNPSDFKGLCSTCRGWKN